MLQKVCEVCKLFTNSLGLQIVHELHDSQLTYFANYVVNCFMKMLPTMYIAICTCDRVIFGPIVKVSFWWGCWSVEIHNAPGFEDLKMSFYLRLCSQTSLRLCLSTVVCKVRGYGIANCWWLTNHKELASLHRLFEVYCMYVCPPQSYKLKLV